MNKKGLFASLLVAVVLISVFFLMFNINKKFVSVSEDLGPLHEAVLKSSADMFLLEKYLSESANFAFGEAMTEIQKAKFSAPNCDINFVSVDKNDDDLKTLTTNAFPLSSCFVLNNQQLHFCYPDLFSAFQDLFYKKFNPYITKFNSVQNIHVPFEGFEMSILDDEYFSVVSASPVSLPLIDEETKVGEAIFRPAFKVPSKTHVSNFKHFSSLFTKLEDVSESCSYEDYSVDEIKNCILKTLGKGFHEIYLKDDLYLINFGFPEACFGIYIPQDFVPSVPST